MRSDFSLNKQQLDDTAGRHFGILIEDESSTGLFEPSRTQDSRVLTESSIV